MADLTTILEGPWSPAAIKSPEAQLHDAISAAGLTPPAEIILDGRIHRFASGTTGHGDRSNKPGWYIAFGDGVPAGRFGCWRAGIEQPWVASIGREVTDAERMANARRMAEAQAARDAERERGRQIAAETVATIWRDAVPASADHPYLARKGIEAHGARVNGDGRLIVPLYAPDGHLSSLQYIDADGGKLYHPGGKTGECTWTVGVADTPGTIYVAEGFATAATIHEATQRPCVVAYSASQLVPAVQQLRARHGAQQLIVIVADNDASGVGQRYAEQAAAKHGARIVMPPELGDANDYHQRGGDLATLLDPPQPSTPWLIAAADFALEPAPIRWLIKRWIQAEALIMIHGPSGGGKTFVALDMALHVAAGLEYWHGHRVHPGPVVYLAGEGHHGLRSRVAAWMQRHGQPSPALWISREGCDLDTPSGYQSAAEAIRTLPEPPQAILVDTLHRFLAGDENSAQDAKAMIDACTALMREFNCSVVLVHHTGVSDEAQHRARGSSAWRGALEIEISVVPAKAPGQPIQIVQRKAKDAELSVPIWVELEAVTLAGWLDEDGQPATSAVIVAADAPAERNRGRSRTDEMLAYLRQAWWHGGAEDRDGRPYVTTSALRDWMTANGGMSAATAANWTKPSRAEGLVGMLVGAGILAAYEHGWTVEHDVTASTWMIEKSSTNPDSNDV